MRTYSFLLSILLLFTLSSNKGTCEPSIQSAYLGALDVPPFLLRFVTGCPQNFGDDGMPLVLSVQVKESSLSPEAFRVISKNGVHSTPNCATLELASESNELHTILLAGPIADPDDLPDRVKIIGAVEDINGNSLTGLVSPTVTVGSSAGPSLINAYLFNQVGGPAGSSPRALQLVWNGGVTGPQGGDLGEAELNAIQLLDCDGNRHAPLGFDDLGDGDNYVERYIPEDVVVNRIEVDANFFYDPANVPNQFTSVQVTSLLPSAQAVELQHDLPSVGLNRIQFFGIPALPYRIFLVPILKTGIV
ncbi:MAG: hypothetical protein ACON4R_00285 [Akkermansiaceae bacterium]